MQNNAADVQFIPATGQPEYAVVPYSMYIALKEHESAEKQAAQLPQAVVISGNPIKYWRQKRGLSQSALAKLAQISIPYLSQLEHSVRIGSKAVLKRLAQALNVAIDQII